MLLATSVMCSLFFFLALYLESVLGYSALSAGLLLLPLTVAIVVVAPLAGRLADHIGGRLPVTIGMLVLAGALFGLSGLRLHSSVWSLMPWLTLAGIGIGLTTTPTTTAAMAGPDSDQYGMAAGVLNTSRATGLAFGIALMGAVLAASGDGAAGRPAAFVDGFTTAVSINALIAIAAAIVAASTLGGHRWRARSSSASPATREQPATESVS
jgi:Na+/melibiose symporter-like transporter